MSDTNTAFLFLTVFAQFNYEVSNAPKISTSTATKKRKTVP